VTRADSRSEARAEAGGVGSSALLGAVQHGAPALAALPPRAPQALLSLSPPAD